MKYKDGCLDSEKTYISRRKSYIIHRYFTADSIAFFAEDDEKKIRA